MSVSHLSSMDLFPFPCNTSGFLPRTPCKTFRCGEGAPSPCSSSSTLQAPRELGAVPPPLSSPNTTTSTRALQYHFPESFSRTVLHDKDVDKCRGSRASEEPSQELTAFVLSSEISALADWHFSCWEKINEEKISWRKIDGDQTNH